MQPCSHPPLLWIKFKTKLYTNVSPLLCPRDQPWRSSWGPRRTWSAQHSRQRRASTVFSARQLWPALTSFSRWPSLAPTAASPNASSTCPAAPSCSHPPSRRRRPRAAQSCEQWGYSPLPTSYALPRALVRGRGVGFPMSSSPKASSGNPSSPPDKMHFRTSGHFAVHFVLISTPVHTCLTQYSILLFSIEV